MDNGYLYELLRKFGLTDFGARTGEFLFEKPIRIGVIILVAWLIVRAAAKAVRRSAISFTRRAPSRLLGARAEQRARTIADALVSLIRVLIWTVAGLLVLDTLN